MHGQTKDFGWDIEPRVNLGDLPFERITLPIGSMGLVNLPWDWLTFHGLVNLHEWLLFGENRHTSPD